MASCYSVESSILTAPSFLQKINSDTFFFSSQIAEHKWAWPFMEPVDVEGLGLHDYHEVFNFLFFSF